jgi:hypothetical protein
MFVEIWRGDALDQSAICAVFSGPECQITDHLLFLHRYTGPNQIKQFEFGSSRAIDQSVSEYANTLMVTSCFAQQINAARCLAAVRDSGSGVIREEKSMFSKSYVFVLALLMMLVMLPAALMADEWNKATKLTFNEPVEVPNMVLAPGAYWFTLADSDADRNIVEIWNSDRTRLITTILAIPDYRLQPTGRTVVHFEERPSDSPEAIHSWFYPGDNYGEEFVYPKSRATQLAKQTNRPVLSMPETTPLGVQQIKQAPVKAVTPSGDEIEVAEVVLSQPMTVNAPPAPSLPKTGSDLPLLELIGLLALGASVGLRIVARNIS